MQVIKERMYEMERFSSCVMERRALAAAMRSR
jgi:hypothetical protein